MAAIAKRGTLSHIRLSRSLESVCPVVPTLLASGAIKLSQVVVSSAGRKGADLPDIAGLEEQGIDVKAQALEVDMDAAPWVNTVRL